jgi:hypothetical protein
MSRVNPIQEHFFVTGGNLNPALRKHKPRLSSAYLFPPSPLSSFFSSISLFSHTYTFLPLLFLPMLSLSRFLLFSFPSSFPSRFFLIHPNFSPFSFSLSSAYLFPPFSFLSLLAFSSHKSTFLPLLFLPMLSLSLSPVLFSIPSSLPSRFLFS